MDLEWISDSFRVDLIHFEGILSASFRVDLLHFEWILSGSFGVDHVEQILNGS